ncbi:unnamed protein product [Porites evermanni]|uniref:P-type domain-containing protein n=1 Tax=Porites evermanni TaxID=104178 RepID=A0ABN8MLM7_9CNID|nr:unnamed protein product [Porites evermanni]
MKKTCQKRSCCWDPDVAEGTPYCYVKDFGQLAYGMCRTAPSERKDCGYVGITKEDCLGKGCCYDNSVDDGKTPWCFYPPDETAATCYLPYTSGLCKYVCDPETEPDHVYGLCSEGRWCCYKNPFTS